MCENCCIINRNKSNSHTFSRNDNDKEKRKVVDSVKNRNNNKKKTKVVNSMKNQTLIIGLSNYSKLHLMNHILHQKQERILIITKSLIQHPNIKAQTSSDEIQLLENYENSTVVFLMICYYPNKKAILICFLLEDVIIILIYTTYLKAIFVSQKILFVIFLI